MTKPCHGTCGGTFVARARNQKYCDACTPDRNRRAALRQREKVARTIHVLPAGILADARQALARVSTGLPNLALRQER